MSEIIPITQPPYDGPTDEEVEAAQKVIEQRQQALAQQARDTLLVCTTQTATGQGCGATQRVGDTIWHQLMRYMEPHGCTDGDYWVESEAEFFCVKCGHRNRLYASPEVEALRQWFKSEERQDV